MRESAGHQGVRRRDEGAAAGGRGHGTIPTVRPFQDCVAELNAGLHERVMTGPGLVHPGGEKSNPSPVTMSRVTPFYEAGARPTARYARQRYLEPEAHARATRESVSSVTPVSLGSRRR
jgi:hypothetical protein